jgi:hypothetical protein
MDWFDLLWKGSALFGAGCVLWYVAKHGWNALSGVASKVVSVVKTDFVALEARVKAIEHGAAFWIPPVESAAGQTQTPVKPPEPVPAAGSSTG